MTFALSLSAAISAQYTGARLIETQQSNILANYGISLSDGAGVNQAQKLWSDRRTLATGVGESLDLNGVLVDGLGNTLALTVIKGIIISAAAANTTTLTIGNIANGLATILGIATQSLTLQPGELLMKITPSAAGYAVTAATADLLRVVNAAGASATYDIIIIGV
jgi:hypothetical protein